MGAFKVPLLCLYRSCYIDPLKWRYMGTYTGVGACLGCTHYFLYVSLSRWVYVANEMHATRNIIRNGQIYSLIKRVNQMCVTHTPSYIHVYDKANYFTPCGKKVTVMDAWMTPVGQSVVHWIKQHTGLGDFLLRRIHVHLTKCNSSCQEGFLFNDADNQNRIPGS